MLLLKCQFTILTKDHECRNLFNITVDIVALLKSVALLICNLIITRSVI
jgi:hypothetical protein